VAFGIGRRMRSRRAGHPDGKGGEQNRQPQRHADRGNQRECKSKRDCRERPIERLQYAEQIEGQPQEDLQGQQPAEENTKNRVTDGERIIWRDLVEDDEAVDGHNDRRKQERLDRVLCETQCLTGQFSVPQALWHKVCGG
jgi:hypothetical protein